EPGGPIAAEEPEGHAPGDRDLYPVAGGKLTVPKLTLEGSRPEQAVPLLVGDVYHAHEAAPFTGAVHVHLGEEHGRLISGFQLFDVRPNLRGRKFGFRSDVAREPVEKVTQ